MSRPPAFPRRIGVELTNHCNQRCRLCPRLGFTRPLGFMDDAVFERIVRECAPNPTTLWLHFLGEPLLHPRLLALLAMARDIGVHQLGLSTNAVTLRGALAEGLLDAGLDRLECSMDAGDREHYRTMRGRDHFDRVTANVRGFLARKRERGLERPVTSIQFMRTPEIEADLPALVADWRPHLGPRDFVMGIAPAPFGGAIDASPAPEIATRPPCHWLSTALMVLQDGTVTMCGADWDAHAPLGNVATTSISDIWHGAEMTRRRRAHAEGRFGDVGPCGDCEDWRLADGRGYENLLEALAPSTGEPGRAR